MELDKPLFIRSNTIIANSEPVEVNWLTVSDCTLQLKNVDWTCKLHATAQSNIEAINCKFSSFKKSESAIRIFANSKAIFMNCEFKNCSHFAVIACDYSVVEFINCKFKDNRIALSISRSSTAILKNCEFEGSNDPGLVICNYSQCQIENCSFKELERAIILKDSSIINIDKSNIYNCDHSGLFLSDFSICNILNSEINNCKTALFSSNHCIVNCQNVKFRDNNGNGIVFLNSTGVIRQCCFDKNRCPSIANIGQFSNPLIVNCEFIHSSTFFCVCKQLAVPLFEHCLFDNCGSHCFSISSFAFPAIKNCEFSNIKLSLAVLFNNGILQNGDIDLQKVKVLPSGKIFNSRSYKSYIGYEKPHSYKTWRSPRFTLPPELPILSLNLSGDKNALMDLSILNINNSKEAIAEIVNYPCGHPSSDTEKCPLCDCIVIQKVKIFKESTCAICYEKEPRATFLPCGHCCVCNECALKIQELRKVCPICNKNFNNLILQ